jgi:protein-L-isoaspartate(D-aspartate) O-methyltransferase
MARVSIEAVDASEAIAESFDAIFVNAGATGPLPLWLDHLRNAARLLVPMTVDLPERWAGIGAGQMLLVSRQEEEYAARFVRPVAVFHCTGARSPTGVGLLRQASLQGGYEHVCRLRRDEHDSNPSCWLHGYRFGESGQRWLAQLKPDPLGGTGCSFAHGGHETSDR